MHQKSPVSAEDDRCGPALQALLHEHFVTSWKTVGSGENLTFVLRLSPAAIDSNTATSFAHTQDNKEPPVQCCPRKPPSQIRRDQKRAEERKGKVCQQASDFLFVCLKLHPIKMLVGLLTTAHHYSTVDTTPQKMHVQLVVIPVLCIMTTCAAVCQLSHTPKTAFVTASETNITHV